MTDDTSPPAEALQRAAVELIGAARVFLDAAEGVVRDPAALRAVLGPVVGLMQTVGESVASVLRPDARTEDPVTEDPVERIDVG
jgi:hypothetical protein